MTQYRGVGALRRAIAVSLRTNLPGYLVMLRLEWNLTDVQLPDPVLYEANEPQALDRFPLIAVVGGGQRVVGRIEPDDKGNPQYLNRYGMSVFVWTRADGSTTESTEQLEGWQKAIERRDDLTAAVVYALLDRPHFDVRPLGRLLLDESTLVVDPSDVQPVKGERFVAGARINFTASIEESVSRGPLGTVRRDRLHVAVVPAHPALD